MKKILTITLFALIFPLNYLSASDNNFEELSIKENMINELLVDLKNETALDESVEIKKQSQPVKEEIFQNGIASFYGERWNGRKTANGEIFNTEKLTAAHKSLKFGTKVKVTNLSNGKSVIVRINDRGPYIKGRIIDLSKAAFREIEKINKGITKVKIQILED